MKRPTPDQLDWAYGILTVIFMAGIGVILAWRG